jgi:hypothetical protein
VPVTKEIEMSDDRLDNALDGMTQESVDAATLDAVRARVWSRLTSSAAPGCASSDRTSARI